MVLQPCFEMCGNDLTIAANWFRTNVSIRDSLMVTIGSWCTRIWRLLSVVWLKRFALLFKFYC